MPVNEPIVVKATMYPVPKPEKGSPDILTVHFNPTTLVYSLENSSPQQKGEPNQRQQGAQFTAKLTMDLQFDTTDTGLDVRGGTRTIASYLNPADAQKQNSANGSDTSTNGSSKKPSKAPPIICFEWGSYQFQGIVESFRETIDFFSAEGVPLRALVSVGMARQDTVFDEVAQAAGDAIQAAGQIAASAGTKLLSLIQNSGGDVAGNRQLAADNGLETPRFTNGAPIQVPASQQLNPASGFAPPPPSGSNSGLGLSLRMISTTSTLSSFGSGTLGAIFGSSASAGVPATAGAFSGLQTGRSSTNISPKIDIASLSGPRSGSNLSAGSGASYKAGGAADNTTGSLATADVGATYKFSDALMFDNDDSRSSQ